MLLNNGEHPFLPEGSNLKDNLAKNLKDKSFKFFNESISE